MLILLPPSETKAPGGDGPALDLDSLLFPSLNSVRATVLDALTALSADLPAARKALGVAASKDPEITGNLHLRTAGTAPAVDRYTGVLYEALDIRSMTKIQRARATGRIAIGSALFGVVSAEDRIPAYRLSAGSRLPGLVGLASLFRTDLEPALAAVEGCVVDLRSGSYAAFAPLAGAVTVRVLTEHPDGSRTIVSHHNKSTKGHLARVLATSRAEMADARDVRRVAVRAGLRVEQPGAHQLDVIV
ncbi:peroxide stress protein YaaA [Nakamurella silvestris]|nr:peroxide stress protein YaaA [Nakamurella silvestris]